MHCVALHLQTEAIKLYSVSSIDADFYARSAFNRYYYATFLCVRKTLITIDSSYHGNLSHKSIPETLKGKIHRKINTIKRRANKIDDTKLFLDCHFVSKKNLEFAESLEKAYAVRLVADYIPETLVDFRSSRFTLSGVSVNEAHEWLAKANFWSDIILQLIKQNNV